MQNANTPGESKSAPQTRPVLAPFPVTRARLLTDEELGKLLLLWFATCEAAKRGLAALDAQVVASVRRHLLETKAENNAVAAVEEALRLAARGDSASAGKRVRAFLLDQRNHAKLMNHVIAGTDRTRAAVGNRAAIGRNAARKGARGALAGRAAGAVAGRAQAEGTRTTRVLNERHRMMNAGLAVRAIPGAVAAKLGMDIQIVREIIRTASRKQG